jgi:hypothetical protein
VFGFKGKCGNKKGGEKMLIPYVGITDFMNIDQVKKMSEVFEKHFDDRGPYRRLHVGVMMSRKTLHDIETKFSKAFPLKENIADIFRCNDVYNCLHYADYSQDDPDFARSLSLAISYGGIGIRAVQLDMIWPDPGQVADGINRSRKRIEVILQVGRNAIELLNNDPQAVAQKLEKYRRVIHRVLLDKSMGRGVPMNPESLAPFVRTIRQKFPNFGISVAGGLGPQTVGLVKPLIDEFPNLSIDAQGKLRPSGSALDPVDWNMAEAYLIEALELFK